ncbi:MAG: GGDEF domain-containing protein, partial [Acetobacteraceae bacterium]|nr:GGDEF domain-containing protein [Acetobacteraceae bacterium]
MKRRLETQLRLAHLAMHDPLTGLPNRALLAERLHAGIEKAKRSGEGLALLYLDLDHFKDVNDTLGHAAGDALLRTVAARFQASVRGDAMVARMGGDEFALWASGIDGPGASALAQRII